MGCFSYKDIYIEDGQRVLEMNILPEKYCNFDCKNIINELSPDKLIVERMIDEKFKKKLGISDERFDEISKILQSN